LSDNAFEIISKYAEQSNNENILYDESAKSDITINDVVEEDTQETTPLATNNEIVEKQQFNETYTKNDDLQFYAIDLQSMNGISYFDGSTKIFSLPSENSLSVNVGISGDVNVLTLVRTHEDETWALIEVSKYLYDDKNAYGYVPIGTLSKNDVVIEDFDERYSITENIEIGQTLDETKLHFGLDYIHDPKDNIYIFYPSDNGYKNVITNIDLLENSRTAYLNALVMKFTKSFNQLYYVEITSSDIVLTSGYTIDSPVEEVITYYNKNYITYISEIFIAKEHYISYILNNNYVLSIRLDDTLENIQSIIIQRKY